MQYLQVAHVCVGCAPLGDMPETFDYGVPLDRAIDTIRAAFASPINFMDTAAAYGESERRTGMVIKELGGLSEGYVLATKGDRDLHTGDFSGEQFKRSIEGGLARPAAIIPSETEDGVVDAWQIRFDNGECGRPRMANTLL